jgi:uncharacterized small protein (DUF1192 family)
MSNNGNGNLFNLSKEEINDGIARLRNEAENTKSEIISKHYLDHAEYWEEVSRKI